jgi:hypothetical protein
MNCARELMTVTGSPVVIGRAQVFACGIHY